MLDDDGCHHRPSVFRVTFVRTDYTAVLRDGRKRIDCNGRWPGARGVSVGRWPRVCVPGEEVSLSLGLGEVRRRFGTYG